jgi:secondary thiamine-phosphate synthase enzyme
MVYGEEISIKTRGFSDVCNITAEVINIINHSAISAGLVNISVIGSTASVSTIEYEDALVADVKDMFEEWIPSTKRTRHSETWGDDNGFSHLRSTLMGPGITLPVHSAAPVLGTWQQIVVIDHDNRSRDRRVFVQVMGE